MVQLVLTASWLASAPGDRGALLGGWARFGGAYLLVTSLLVAAYQTSRHASRRVHAMGALGLVGCGGLWLLLRLAEHSQPGR
jgi:hypothetical protein